VNEIEITSEAGALLKLILPWSKGGTIKNNSGVQTLKSGTLKIATVKGEIISLKP
jgi:hypothetical protein